MKQLFILFALSVFIQNSIAQTPIPQCTVLSINHFGGNGDDAISTSPGIITYPDGTFSLTINTGSDSGNINTNCTPSWFFQRYNAGGTVVLDETCAPVGTNFQYPAYFVFPQSNGDTILIGQSNDSSGNYGMERRDASGNVLWTKSYGSSGNEGFYSAVPAPDGSGFFINGGSNSSGGDVGLHYGDQFHYDIWIIKVDEDGNLIWSKVIGGTYQDGIEDMVPADDGGLYLFGETNSYDHDMVGNHSHEGDVYVAKLDSLGNIEWHHCYGGTGTDGGPHIHAIKDHNGGFHVGAVAGSSDGDVQRRPAMAWDFWLLHIDSIGNLLWENTYGGPNFEFIYDMCRSTDGSIWIGGISGGGNGVNPVGGDVSHNYGGKDAWVVHVDTMGNIINTCTLGNDNNDYLFAIHPLPEGKIFVAGVYSSIKSGADNTSDGFPKLTYKGGNDWDIFTARLSPQDNLGITSQQTLTLSWTLFPNPASREFSVGIKNDNRKFNITVTDVHGKSIYKDRFKSKITIPTFSWAVGTYWVTVSRNGRSDTKKLIIQK